MEQIIYNILTYIIIATATFVTLKKIYDKFAPKKANKSGCDSGCGGCGSPCELKEVITKQNSQ